MTKPSPGESFATFALWVLTRAALLAAVWIWDAGDDITELAWTWAQDVLHGRSPYHEVAVAYPPLAMLGFALPGLAAPGPDGYALPFALTMLAVDAFGARVGGRRYVLAVPAIGPVLLLWRYDLAPAVCHLAAGAAALRGRRDASWAWLGVGIALKPYLLVAVPLWLLWDRRARGLLIAAAPSVLAAALMLPIAGGDVLDPYLFQGQREVSVEATPAVLSMLLGVGQTELDQACLCWVRTGIDPAGTVGTALGLLLLAGIWRGRNAVDPVAGSVAAVAAVLLTAPVFSPQYLVWLIPPAVLLSGRALTLAAAAALTGFLAYPILYDEVLAGSALPLLLLRIALLIAVLNLARGARTGASAAKARDEHDGLPGSGPGRQAARGGGGVAAAGARVEPGPDQGRGSRPALGLSRRLRPR